MSHREPNGERILVLTSPESVPSPLIPPRVTWWFAGVWERLSRQGCLYAQWQRQKLEPILCSHRWISLRVRSVARPSSLVSWCLPRHTLASDPPHPRRIREPGDSRPSPPRPADHDRPSRFLGGWRRDGVVFDRGVGGRSAQYRGRTGLCVRWKGLWSGGETPLVPHKPTNTGGSVIRSAHKHSLAGLCRQDSGRVNSTATIVFGSRLGSQQPQLRRNPPRPDAPQPPEFQLPLSFPQPAAGRSVHSISHRPSSTSSAESTASLPQPPLPLHARLPKAHPSAVCSACRTIERR